MSTYAKLPIVAGTKSAADPSYKHHQALCHASLTVTDKTFEFMDDEAGEAMRTVLESQLSLAELNEARQASTEDKIDRLIGCAVAQRSFARVEDRFDIPWPGNMPRRMSLDLFAWLLQQHNPAWRNMPLVAIPAALDFAFSNEPIDAGIYRLRLERGLANPDGYAELFVVRTPINGG